MVAGALDTILIPSLRLEEILSDGSTLSNPAADSRRVFLGEDGLLHLRDSAGTVTDIGAGTVATDALWDAKGDLAVGTGANTAAKLTVGANDTIIMADSAQTTGLKYVASQTPTTQAFSDAATEGTADTFARGDHKHGMPASPGGGSSLLAATAYAPVGDGTVATSSSGTLADADATNLQVAFTAPASGKVLVRLSALMDMTAADNVYWGIRESTTDVISQIVWGFVGSPRLTATFYITGISGGSHTYKWSHKRGSGTTHIYGGPTYGQCVMEIWAAP